MQSCEDPAASAGIPPLPKPFKGKNPHGMPTNPAESLFKSIQRLHLAIIRQRSCSIRRNSASRQRPQKSGKRTKLTKKKSHRIPLNLIHQWKDAMENGQGTSQSSCIRLKVKTTSSLKSAINSFKIPQKTPKNPPRFSQGTPQKTPSGYPKKKPLRISQKTPQDIPKINKDIDGAGADASVMF